MRLLGAENIGGRVERTWLHTDDSGNDVITVQAVQDVAPVFSHVKRSSEGKGRDMRYRGSVPATVLEDMAKISAASWGVTKIEAFREIMGNKTDRARKVWSLLLDDRDYRRLQANGA